MKRYTLQYSKRKHLGFERDKDNFNHQSVSLEDAA